MLPAVLAAVALVVVATVAGLLWKRLDGRRRDGSGRLVRPADLGLPADAFGERATVLQFSSEWCTRCPAARRVLGDAARRTAGVRHAEVDLTHRPDLASRFGVLQTPTTLVLDARGAERARIGGAPRPAEVDAALSELVDA